MRPAGEDRAVWLKAAMPPKSVRREILVSMRIIIISDLHANIESLSALPDDCDELWVLGDLVNYGPSPVEVVDAIRQKATLVVRGNHDHSAGYGTDPRCSERFRRMAEATGRYTAAALDASRKQFLRDLPLEVTREVDGVRFRLCHATLSEPLYPYCRAESDRWPAEAASAGADLLLVGHTHLPFRREFPGCTVVNPGSLGQPKHGRPEACYALWNGSGIELKSYSYAFEETAWRVEALPLDAGIQHDLTTVLRSGSIPSMNA